jgi:hypothetical protein
VVGMLQALVEAEIAPDLVVAPRWAPSTASTSLPPPMPTA